MADALRLAPGVEVERNNSNQWSIGVRGFGDRLARSVLVLIDGRAVYSPLFGGTFWEVQDDLLEDIDRIEVIRGPGGMLWGANAVNGVINIITKSAKETQGGLVTAGGGTFERGFTGVRYGTKVGEDFSYRVYGKYFNRNSTLHSDGNNYDDWQMGQGGFRTDWNVNDRDNLTVQGDLYAGDTGETATFGTFAPPYFQTLTQNGNLQGANVLGRWNRKIDAASDTSLQWYYDRTNRIDPAYREFRNTFDVEFQHHLAWVLRQELTWGLNYRLTSNLIDSVPAVVFDPLNRTDNLFSGFIQDQIALLESLRFIVGTKVEHNDYSGWEVEPSGRLAWTPTPLQTFWTAVSKAVATPTQGDQNFSFTAPGFGGTPPVFLRLVANSDFQSQELTAYEWGYRVQPIQPIFLDLATFYNRYDNLRTGEQPAAFLESTPTSDNLIIPVVEGNKMSGETHGLETSATWNATSWWRWRVNYSLLLIHLRTDADSTDASNRPEATAGSSPRHLASLQWSLNLPHGFEWDPIVRYADALSALRTSAYWNYDMRIAWHVTKQLELAIIGQNLAEPQHSEADPAQQIPRGVYGKATWLW